MFGRRKKHIHSHRQRVLEELAESIGHLRMAAGHAAGGAAERVAPSYDRARMEASKRWHTTRGTLSPLYEQVRQGTTHARKDKHVPRKKWPVLIALLAAGATVGATGAVIARRRRAAAQWDEYEPLPAIDEPSYGAGISSASKKVTAGAASVADSVSNQAGKLAESLHEKSARTSPASPAGGSATSGGSTKSGGSASSGGSAASGGSPNTSSPSGAFAPFADEADEAATKANTKNTR